MITEFVEKLRTDFDLANPLPMVDDDSYALYIDDLQITIKDDSPGFSLYCKIGNVPTKQQEAFFSHMLRGNLFGQATHNALLGLDATGNKVVLRHFYEKKPTYQDFFNTIEDFINTVFFWKEQIHEHPSPAMQE